MMRSKQGSTDQLGETRRTKRKADEVGKHSSRNPRRRIPPRRASSSAKKAVDHVSNETPDIVTTPSGRPSGNACKPVAGAKTSRSGRSNSENNARKGTGTNRAAATPSNVGGAQQSGTVSNLKRRKLVDEDQSQKVSMLLRSNNISPELISILEAQLPNTSPTSNDSDGEESHSNSNVNDDVVEDVEDPDIVFDKDDQVNAPNLGESDDEQEVSYTKQVIHEPFNSAADDENDIHVSTEQINQKLPSQTNMNGDAIDNSAVLTIVQGLKKFITDQMDLSFNKLRDEVRSDKEDIRKIREDVTQATSIITATASSLFIKQPSASSRTKEIHKQICLLPAIFNDNTMLMIFPPVVTGFFATGLPHGSSFTTISSKGILFYSVMNFSLQPNEKKQEKFSSEVGRVYSKFRFSLLMSSFLALQRNTFKWFRDDSMDSVVIDGDSSGDRNTSGTKTRYPMLQPFWLKPGFVVSEHCINAASKMEGGSNADISDDPSGSGETPHTLGDNESSDTADQGTGNESSQSSTRKPNRTGPLTRNEIANESASMLYRITTSILSRSRNASKLQLFHDLTYLFVSWSNHGCQVDQNSLSIAWEAPLTADVDYIDGVVRTKVLRQYEQRVMKRRELDQMDLDNITHLEVLISEHPELSLIIEHDVVVNSAVTRLRFRMNLIEVACRYLASYITLDSASKVKDALSADKRSLKVILVLAIGLRQLLEKAIHDMSAHGKIPWYHNSATKVKRGRPRRSSSNGYNPTQLTQYMFQSVDGMSLENLQPPPSKQKEALNQMVLKLTEQELASKMGTVSGDGRTTHGNSEVTRANGSDLIPIEADESQGVFAL